VEPIPETRYAQAVDGGQIAYQVAGSGPTVMLGFNPYALIDVMWEEPRFVRLLDRLSSFTRHVWLDPRDQRSSSVHPGGGAQIIESVTDDMVAVLDALDEERAIVLGMARPPALLFAATHPARTSALILVGASARFREDEGYLGLDNGAVEQMVARIEPE